MSSEIQSAVNGHTLEILLNRPDARNAVNGALANAMEEALDRLEEDPDIWCAILSGSGSAFCAGADLKEIAAGRADTLATKRGGFAGIVRRDRSKPIIAAVDGPALAGGTEIVLACDLIVASHRATFGLPEVKRSLVAGAGGLFRLAGALPKHIAIELLLTGDSLTAATAAHFGMVNRLVDDGQALDEARKLAESITSNAPVAIFESLKVARASTASNENELFNLSAKAMMAVMATEDFKEGPRAFIEKRPPRWTGR